MSNLRCSERSVKGFCILKFSMRATVVLDSLSCCISIYTNVERGLFVGVRVHMSLDQISKRGLKGLLRDT